jgi:hypothetical protein
MIIRTSSISICIAFLLVNPAAAHGIRTPEHTAVHASFDIVESRITTDGADIVFTIIVALAVTFHADFDDTAYGHQAEGGASAGARSLLLSEVCLRKIGNNRKSATSSAMT